MMRSGLVALALLMASAGGARAACTIGKIADLPVTMAGTRPMVTAQIDGQDVQFLADSGAFFSTLSPGSVAQLHLRAQALFGVRLMGVGGDAQASVTTVKTFTLAGTPLHNVDFVVGGSEVQGAAVGVMGQNVLGLADVEYDLAGGMIRLLTPRGCGRETLAYWAAGKPISLLDIAPPVERDRHTIGTVAVNGGRVRAIFDTGASVTVLSLAAAARAGVKPGGPGVRSAGFVSGLGPKPIETWVGPFDSFQVGGEEVRHTRLRFGGPGLDGVDMLIGADFFLSHHVYVANGQRRLYFTYNGGPVFNLEVDPSMIAKGEVAAKSEAGKPGAGKSGVGKSGGADSGSEGVGPGDADAFARRGAALAARRQFQPALADLDRAVALAPDQPRLLYQRVQVHAAFNQPFLALADIDAVLKLKPDDADARVFRAELRVADHDTGGAKEDLDVAVQHTPREADTRLRLAQLYESTDAFEPAIEQYDAWITVHPDDYRRAQALNGRCWARALMGRELDRAVGDCDAALRIRRDAQFLDSRGLVRLRRGEFDRAIADYDAALALSPKQAWSLYGRGLAKARRGLDGTADLAAAALIAPHLPERAHKLGVAP